MSDKDLQTIFPFLSSDSLGGMSEDGRNFLYSLVATMSNVTELRQQYKGK